MSNRIKMLREELGMTQVRLSIELDVTQETVSAYEMGKHFPSVEVLITMSKLFHASVDFILGLSDVRLAVKSDDESEQLYQQAVAIFSRLSPSYQQTALQQIRSLLDLQSENKE